MSKAFTRESDEPVAEPAPRRRDLELPPGVTNYVTPAGAQRLRDELDDLLRRPAPDAAAKQRIADLTDHLALAEVVDPAAQSHDRVRFGARVTLSTDDGDLTYRIVGVAEADPRRGAISFLSPVARALLGARVGDTVKLPTGELEVVAIDY
jgi:transcription elongation factor GreB